MKAKRKSPRRSGWKKSFVRLKGTIKVECPQCYKDCQHTFVNAYDQNNRYMFSIHCSNTDDDTGKNCGNNMLVTVVLKTERRKHKYWGR